MKVCRKRYSTLLAAKGRGRPLEPEQKRRLPNLAASIEKRVEERIKKLREKGI